jgi:hypothetical protein
MYSLGLKTSHVWLKTYEDYGPTYLRVWVFNAFTPSDGRADYTTGWFVRWIASRAPCLPARRVRHPLWIVIASCTLLADGAGCLIGCRSSSAIAALMRSRPRASRPSR